MCSKNYSGHQSRVIILCECKFVINSFFSVPYNSPCKINIINENVIDYTHSRFEIKDNRSGSTILVFAFSDVQTVISILGTTISLGSVGSGDIVEYQILFRNIGRMPGIMPHILLEGKESKIGRLWKPCDMKIIPRMILHLRHHRICGGCTWSFSIPKISRFFKSKI